MKIENLDNKISKLEFEEYLYTYTRTDQNCKRNSFFFINCETLHAVKNKQVKETPSQRIDG